MFKGDHADARRPGELHAGVQRSQGLAEVARIGGDAVLGNAQHRMQAVETADGLAPRAGPTLVAGPPCRIAEIGAAGALQDVAAERGHVADLGARRQRQGLGDHRIILDHGRVIGGFGHAYQGAQVQPVRPGGDLSVGRRQAVDVDQRLGLHRLHPHQVDQGGAACQEGGGRPPRPAPTFSNRLFDRGSALIHERSHAQAFIWPAACLMAATMCG